MGTLTNSVPSLPTGTISLEPVLICGLAVCHCHSLRQTSSQVYSSSWLYCLGHGPLGLGKLGASFGENMAEEPSLCRGSKNIPGSKSKEKSQGSNIPLKGTSPPKDPTSPHEALLPKGSTSSPECHGLSTIYHLHLWGAPDSALQRDALGILQQ